MNRCTIKSGGPPKYVHVTLVMHFLQAKSRTSIKQIFVSHRPLAALAEPRPSRVWQHCLLLESCRTAFIV